MGGGQGSGCHPLLCRPPLNETVEVNATIRPIATLQMNGTVSDTHQFGLLFVVCVMSVCVVDCVSLPVVLCMMSACVVICVMSVCVVVCVSLPVLLFV